MIGSRSKYTKYILSPLLRLVRRTFRDDMLHLGSRRSKRLQGGEVIGSRSGYILPTLL